MPTEHSVTARQKEILWWARKGLTDKAIARRLGIAKPTVSHHMSEILVRLQCANRAEACAKATRLRLLPSEEG